MFYRIIKKHKMKGIPTNSNEVFGKFELGGFFNLNFVDHLKKGNANKTGQWTRTTYSFVYNYWKINNKFTLAENLY